MEDTDRIRTQLGGELEALRQRLTALEKAEEERRQMEEQVKEGQRRRLALDRVHRAILEMESVEDFGKVVQVIARELQDLGTKFEGIGLNIIDEEEGTLTAYAAFADDLSVQAVHSLEHPVNQELLRHWRRGQVWEREPNEAFREASKGYDVEEDISSRYAPTVVIDSPFVQGTLAVGLHMDVGGNDPLIQLLEEFCSLLSLGYQRGSDMARRQEAEEALRQAHDELEDRVRERTAALGEVNEALQREIGERQQVEEQLKTSLGEKEVLLKEIHHRVKNNLQIVCSLLDLQARYVENQQMLGMFQDSQNRVRSMALIHEKLYESADLARIDLEEYVRELAEGLFNAYGAHAAPIALDVQIQGDDLGIDEAIPCGLIITELVSNAFKHGFPKGRGGTVYVGMQTAEDDEMVLTVRDDGVGFPEDIDFQHTESLGLRLVVNLTRQLRGRIELSRAGGTEFGIRFPHARGR